MRRVHKVSFLATFPFDDESKMVVPVPASHYKTEACNDRAGWMGRFWYCVKKAELARPA